MSRLTIKQIFKSDQEDRKKLKEGKMDYDSLVINDNLRRKAVFKIIKRDDLSGIDYFYAAFPFHHSHKITHLKIALRFAKESLAKGYKKARKLINTVEDRIYLVGSVPQKHGTQFILKNGKAVKYKTE